MGPSQLKSQRKDQRLARVQVSPVALVGMGIGTRIDRQTTSANPKVSLNGQEWSRKCWHMSAGLLPFICPIMKYFDPSAASLPPSVIRIIILGLTTVLIGLSYACSKRFTRPGERSIGMAMGCYVISVVVPLVVFAHRLEIGMTILAVLSIGDGAAGLVGMTLKGPQLSWNPRKTIAGTLGFLFFACPAASGVYWVIGPPSVSWTIAVAIGCITSLVAAIAESVPSKIDDNLRVGVTAAATLVTCQLLIVGIL